MRQFLRAFIIFVLLFSAVILISPLVLPIFFGVLLFPVTYPTYLKLLKHKWKKSLAALFIITLFIAVFLVPGILIGIHGANMTIDYLKQNENSGGDPAKTLVDDQQKNVDKLEELSQKVEDKFGFSIPPTEKLLKDNLKKLSTFLVTSLTGLLRAIPDFVLAYIIVLLTMYFTLVEAPALKKFLLKYTLLSPVRSERLLKILYMSSRSVIISNVLTGITQATIVGLGALFTRSGDFFVIAFITFILSFIPVVGAAPVAFGLGLLRMSGGDYTQGIILFIVGGIAGVADNILRPYFLRGEIHVHPFFSLLAIIGGVVVLGLPGLFIGPLVFTIVHETVPLYIQEYKDNKPTTDL